MSHPTTSTESLVGSTSDRWRDIFNNPNHNAQTWACVRAAISHADDTVTRTAAAATNPDHPDLDRGGPLWTQAAVNSYRLLSDTGAYIHLSTGATNHCVADVEAIRTWLTAPLTAPGMASTVVGDQLDVDDDFLEDDEYRPGRLAKLIDSAQLAGVLRTDRAQVQLWHMSDDDGDLIGHRLAIAHDDGVVLSSRLLQVDNLANSSLTGIDAAADLLINAATIANDVLTHAIRAQATPSRSVATLPNTPTQAAPTDSEQEPVPKGVTGHRVGRAFPPPGQRQGESSPAYPQPDAIPLGRSPNGLRP